jgi:hypothetical protein
VRNDAARLGQCLASILASDYPPRLVEIVVVDNGSTDASREVAQRGGAEVLTLPHLPVSELRNRGARHATGDILAFVDADHEIDAEWVSVAVGHLMEGGVGGVGALCDAPAGANWVQRSYDLMRRKPALEDVEWLGSGNLAVTREAFERAGGFDPTLQTCEDVDLCRRLRRAGYRLVHDARLRNVHFGDPATLAALFRGELWRGRDNLRVSLRGPLTARELPSVIVPLANLAFMAVAILGGTIGGGFGIVLVVTGVAGVLTAPMARAGRMLHHAGHVTPFTITQAYLVALTYDLARALALVRPGGHQARRGEA